MEKVRSVKILEPECDHLSSTVLTAARTQEVHLNQLIKMIQVPAGHHGKMADVTQTTCKPLLNSSALSQFINKITTKLKLKTRFPKPTLL